jgi:hypothetical protein
VLAASVPALVMSPASSALRAFGKCPKAQIPGDLRTTPDDARAALTGAMSNNDNEMF